MTVLEYDKLSTISQAEQIDRGYGHTLREVWQQPETWVRTARSAALSAAATAALQSSAVVTNRGAIVLTGSGSSQFVGDCLALPLQKALGIPVCSLPSGLLLTHLREALPPIEPLLLVSIARSGNSPESVAVQQQVMQHAPKSHHWVITCNAQGKLATEQRGNPQVTVALLDERTNDRSLVMTSSFTNLTLAGRLLATLTNLESWQNAIESVAEAGQKILNSASDKIAHAARLPFRSAIYLGDGCHFGAAREAALKMLEMTAGRIGTMSESFLGFRHGPMSATSSETLVVAFLSADSTVRAYELDLLAELQQKQLGLHTIIAGSNLPAEFACRQNTTLIDFRLPDEVSDADTTVLHVMVGQLVALFRCLQEGLKPDAPSAAGVMSRVVAPFRIY